ASAEEDGRHFARATRALAFFNGLLEAALQPFIHGVFHREQPWLVFSPHALAQHQGFLDVAV
ncbi:hypothetical protein QOU18_25790, partial [Pseudomonas aeruginosa]